MVSWKGRESPRTSESHPISLVKPLSFGIFCHLQPNLILDNTRVLHTADEKDKSQALRVPSHPKYSCQNLNRFIILPSFNSYKLKQPTEKIMR